MRSTELVASFGLHRVNPEMRFGEARARHNRVSVESVASQAPLDGDRRRPSIDSQPAARDIVPTHRTQGLQWSFVWSRICQIAARPSRRLDCADRSTVVCATRRRASTWLGGVASARRRYVLQRFARVTVGRSQRTVRHSRECQPARLGGAIPSLVATDRCIGSPKPSVEAVRVADSSCGVQRVNASVATDLVRSRVSRPADCGARVSPTTDALVRRNDKNPA